MFYMEVENLVRKNQELSQINNGTNIQFPNKSH